MLRFAMNVHVARGASRVTHRKRECDNEGLSDTYDYLILLHKVNKCCPFYLDWLTMDVIKREHKMKKVAFA